MKNRFQHAIAATALLALGFAASPVLADDPAAQITYYVEIARSVFGGDKTAGDVVSSALADATDAKETVGELAAALSAAEVAKDDPAVVDALAGAEHVREDRPHRPPAEERERGQHRQDYPRNRRGCGGQVLRDAKGSDHRGLEIHDRTVRL